MGTIRFATIEDVATVHGFIVALAQYERLEHEVSATVDDLKATLFSKKPCAEVLLCTVEHKAVGFALFFTTYSTFLGKPGIHLEDLFVLPKYRQQGYGKKLLDAVISIAKERHCGRVEWNVLDWNERAINFYLRMGAKPVSGWTRYRLRELDIQSHT